MEPLQVKDARVGDRREVGTCAYARTCTQNMHKKFTYMCTHICSYTQKHMKLGVHVHIYAYMHMHSHIQGGIFIFVSIHIDPSDNKEANIIRFLLCVCICMHLCVCSYLCACEYMFIHVCPILYMSMQGRISISMYVFINMLLMFVCVYVHICT